MCNGAGPRLVTVIVCTLLVLPCVVLGKVKLPGIKLTAERGVAPVPVSGIDCGLPGALSIVLKLACRTPVAVGEKAKLTVHVAFGARTVGREHVGVSTKSPASRPVTVIEVRLR